MPLYEFICDETGETIEEFSPMREAPPIGTVIERDGKKFRRVFCGDINAQQIARVTHQYPYQSHSMPRLPNGKKPFIRSQAHEREIAARYEMEKH